jgi:hypothetical protein
MVQGPFDFAQDDTLREMRRLMGTIKKSYAGLY